jgi:hypothetical protein
MDRDDGARGRAATTTDRTLGEYIAVVTGAVYVLVGILGFFVTGGVEFAATQGDKLLGVFEVNPLHNLVHLAIGIALIAAFYSGAAAVRAVATIIGAVYVILGIAGFFIEGEDVNILALNGPDHVLHLASGAVLLAAAALTRPAGELSARRAT